MDDFSAKPEFPTYTDLLEVKPIVLLQEKNVELDTNDCEKNKIHGRRNSWRFHHYYIGFANDIECV
jgi:hypothetical protein